MLRPDLSLIAIFFLFSLSVGASNVPLSLNQTEAFTSQNLSEKILWIMANTNAVGSLLPSTNDNQSFQNASGTSQSTRVISENEFNLNFISSTLFTSVLVGVLTGLFTGIAIVKSDIYLHAKRKPKISIDKSQIITREFDINAYEINEPTIPSLLRIFPVKYIANRITVKNEGMTAAEESKGAFRITKIEKEKIEETEVKLRWVPTIEQYKMTINAHSEEYLDACAVRKVDNDEIIKKLFAHVDELEKYINAEVAVTNIKRALTIQIEEIKKYYDPKSPIDSRHDIPYIVAPTENGWPPLNASRKLKPSSDSKKYRLIVTSRNSNKIDEGISIESKSDSEGRVIRFLNLTT